MLTINHRHVFQLSSGLGKIVDVCPDWPHKPFPPPLDATLALALATLDALGLERVAIPGWPAMLSPHAPETPKGDPREF